MLRSLTAAALFVLAPISAVAEIIEVQMLNRGEAGSMIFEPRYVEANVGDTVVFIATDRGHNAESMEGMLPEGQDPFEGELNEEISIELTAEGMIGVGCKPHLGMGMVMVIAVGDAEVPDDFLETRMPRRAKGMFEEILAEKQ